MLAPPTRVGALHDAWFVAGVGVAWLGTSIPGASMSVALGAVALAWLGRRLPVLLLVALVLLASARMGETVGELASRDEGPVFGIARVVSDPEVRGVATRLDLEVGGARWEVWARGPLAYSIDGAEVGERWEVSGVASLATPDQRRWLWPRGAAGRMTLTSAERVDRGAWRHRVANDFRGLVEGSATSLSARDRALLTGFVHGDERGQLPEVVDDFRGSGLTHLLAVSGSNVAVVLVMLDPLLRRLTPGWRLVVVCLVLAEFAIITRAEPSVLRACVLALLSSGVASTGRRASGVRLLSVAVMALLLIEPMLARSVGFQLSVAASLGIALLAKRLATHLLGPSWIRQPLAITIAAQVAVTPVQLWVFGSLPLASLPANLLAGPVAGPAMLWGLHAGVVGGVSGEPLAGWLHVPTRWLVGWVAKVAEWGAGSGLPQIERDELIPALIVLVCGIGAVAAWPSGRRLAVPAVALALLVVSSGRPNAPVDPHLRVVGHGAVVVLDRPEAAWALGELRRSGVRSIDTLIARSGSGVTSEAVRAIAARIDVGVVVGPDRLGSDDTLVVTDRLDTARFAIQRDGARLVVTRLE